MHEWVLVTGVSGFLGGHVALELLKAGYRVRGSVRSLAKGAKVREALERAGANVSSLEFVELDLLSDKGWEDAAKGCDFLQHIASPFVLERPKDPDVLIRPAVEGTRRALESALAAGVSRMVVTSSLAAIDSGHRDYSRLLTENDWSDLSGPNVNAYMKSKTLAEREAWRIVDGVGERDRLAVINPGAILGPLLDDDPGTSGNLIVRLLNGRVPMAPRVILEYVDVRDVAHAHVAAMEAPGAGSRLIVSDKAMSLMEVVAVLRSEFPSFAQKLPRREMPDWFARFVSLFDASLRDSAAFIGRRLRSDASEAVKLLGRPLIPARDAAIATAQSAIEHGLV
jgi:dihydroflavonol-4-reductase